MRHGQGYSRLRAHGVDVADGADARSCRRTTPVKIRRLRLRNRSDRPRRLTVTLYVEWVLGTTATAPQRTSSPSIDPDAGALFARNRLRGPRRPGRVPRPASQRRRRYTADRTEFLGRNGSRSPAGGADRRARSPGASGPGSIPAAAIQVALDLAAGETCEVVFLLGEAATTTSARDAGPCATATPSAAAAALDDVVSWWDALLGTVQVRTPDRALDLLVNRWLLYQALACRFWARSAFYQSGGAFGFRDQLQDVLALLHAAPELAREHILRAAARQFVEGDVQHWWHPDTGQGVRTRCSDDLLWLPYVTAAYVTATGDAAILDERRPVPRVAPS